MRAGDKVKCRTGGASWSRGTIVKLNYKLDDWGGEGQARKALGRSTVPYQIKLNNGDLIFCPMDVEECIRRAV